jgi:hypothetical protein
MAHLFLSYHRLITILSILLLNPLPFIYGAPTKKIDNNLKLQRQKRQIDFNNDDIMINKNVFIPEEEIIFEGLLGLTDFFSYKRIKILFYINRLQIRFQYMQSR